MPLQLQSLSRTDWEVVNQIGRLGSPETTSPTPDRAPLLTLRHPTPPMAPLLVPTSDIAFWRNRFVAQLW